MKRTLPASLDAVAGLRAARWIRESTTGQYDNFGPDAQREQQDRAIARWGLVDGGLEWSVAASGWKDVWRTPEFLAMLDAARQREFDVLVVGYVSRFMRNLRQTLNAIQGDLQPAGVAVLFADERLLTSDDGDWDQFVREAAEAESYSRKLSKRVIEGLGSKRRRLGVPGGNRPPYGIIRSGHPSELRVDQERIGTVRRAFELAATGRTDLEVAQATGLKKTHVTEILTHPIYIGRLRGGEPAGLPPVIDSELWSTVQTARERRRTRTPGRIVKRGYALRLSCQGCGRFLYGDVGRYRHPAPTCLPFRAATPLVEATRRRPTDRRTKGHSYPQDWYEGAIGALLASVNVDDGTKSEIVRLHADHDRGPDELALARIARQRAEAGRRLDDTRDIAAWQVETARLDALEVAVRTAERGPRLSPSQVVDYLRSLPTLWRDSDANAKQSIATAIFASISVLGFRELEVELTADAVDLGLDMVVPGRTVLGGEVAEFGRGERI